MEYYLTPPAAKAVKPVQHKADYFNKDMIQGDYDETTPIGVSGLPAPAPRIIKRHAINTNTVGVSAPISNPAPKRSARDMNRGIIEHKPTSSFVNGSGLFEAAVPIRTPIGVDVNDQDRRNKAFNESGAISASGGLIPVLTDYIAVANSMSMSPNLTEDEKYQIDLIASALNQLNTIRGIRSLTDAEIAIQTKLFHKLTEMSNQLTAINIRVFDPRPAVGMRLPTTGDLFDEGVRTRGMMRTMFGDLGNRTEAKLDEVMLANSAQSRRQVSGLNDILDELEESGVKLDTLNSSILGLPGYGTMAPMAPATGTGAPLPVITLPTTPVITAPGTTSPGGTLTPAPTAPVPTTPTAPTGSSSSSSSSGTPVIPTLTLPPTTASPYAPLAEEVVKQFTLTELGKMSGGYPVDEKSFSMLSGLVPSSSDRRTLKKLNRTEQDKFVEAVNDEINKVMSTVPSLTTPVIKSMGDDTPIIDESVLLMPTFVELEKALSFLGIDPDEGAFMSTTERKEALDAANRKLENSKIATRKEIDRLKREEEEAQREEEYRKETESRISSLSGLKTGIEGEQRLRPASERKLAELPIKPKGVELTTEEKVEYLRPGLLGELIKAPLTLKLKKTTIAERRRYSSGGEIQENVGGNGGGLFGEGSSSSSLELGEFGQPEEEISGQGETEEEVLPSLEDAPPETEAEAKGRIEKKEGEIELSETDDHTAYITPKEATDAGWEIEPPKDNLVAKLKPIEPISINDLLDTVKVRDIDMGEGALGEKGIRKRMGDEIREIVAGRKNIDKTFLNSSLYDAYSSDFNRIFLILLRSIKNSPPQYVVIPQSKKALKGESSRTYIPVKGMSKPSANWGYLMEKIKKGGHELNLAKSELISTGTKAGTKTKK